MRWGQFQRRQFLSNSLYGVGASALRPILPALAMSTISQRAFAQNAPVIANPILANVNLEGGPDFRHLFVPEYSSDQNSYGYAYWAHRYNSHGIGESPAAWAARWSTDYDLVVSGGTRFGILKKAGWLKTMWDLGKVAIINNVLGSEDRDHHRSSIIYETGVLTATKGQVARDGWGGRLSNGLNANIVSLSHNVKQFCFGPDSNNAESHTIDRIISARDSRNLGLFVSAEKTASIASTSSRAIMDRSLTSYFAAKSITAASKHQIFKTHEEKLRLLGDLVKARLTSYPIPTELGQLNLANSGFQRQLTSLYDCLICHDLLNLRIASMTYGGWDSHKNQATDIERWFQDLFGTSRGLHSLYTNLSTNLPSASNKLIFMLGGEFGRQLAANGGGGTDHGRGMTVILIGQEVQGGIYGSLFPSSELSNTSNGYQQGNSDILGRTTINSIFARVANKMQPGLGSSIFNLSQATVETAGMFDNLF